MCNRLRHLIYIFYRLRTYFHVSKLRQIYCVLFLSIASYGIIAWGSSAWCNLKPLEIIHKKFLQCMHGVNILFATKNLFELTKALDIRLHYCAASISQLIKSNEVSYVKNNRNTRSALNKNLKFPCRSTNRSDRAWDVLGSRAGNCFGFNLSNFKRANDLSIFCKN